MNVTNFLFMSCLSLDLQNECINFKNEKNRRQNFGSSVWKKSPTSGTGTNFFFKDKV